MRGSHWAALPPNPGAPARRSRSWQAVLRVPTSSAALRRRRWPTRDLPETTYSRSSWRNGSSCAPWRSRRQDHRHASQRFPPPRSPLQLERCMTPEIKLTQAPAQVRHGSNIGQPLTRRDGVLKVKGEARYAADNHPPGMLHAVLAVSSIARGRVIFLDLQAAKGHPGVVDVMTAANRPPLAED